MQEKDVTLSGEQVTTQTQKSVGAPLADALKTTCCIVGSGPAGAVLALLLARNGIPEILLEEHMDFDRDFRGGTIHPSVIQITDEIGAADRLRHPHHTNTYQSPLPTPNVEHPIT